MNNLSYSELKEKAISLGIEIKGNPKKDELIKKIENVGQDSSLETVSNDKNNNKVIVYCKLPFGLSFRRGLREIKFNGLPITGFYGSTLNKKIPSQYTIEFGKTYNIDKSDWEYFKAVYKDQKFIKNNFIFAVEDASEGNDKAEDLKEMETGLEPVKMKGDSRTKTVEKKD